jgi:hypothetical protein
MRTNRDAVPPGDDPQSRFAETYSRMSSDELKRIFLDRNTLVPQATSALERECAKRGIDEASAKAYRELEVRDVEESKREKVAERHEHRRTVWPQRAILLGGGIVTPLLAEYAFGLSNEVVYLLTKMTLYLALAAIALTWAIGGRWLTVKRTWIAAVLLYGGVLIWILLTVRGHQVSRH